MGADGLRKGHVAAVLHQGYRNVLVGSRIFTTNPKVSRTNIMPIGISLANDPAHYLHFSTCSLLPCDQTTQLHHMAGTQVCCCSSDVAQEFWKSSCRTASQQQETHCRCDAHQGRSSYQEFTFQFSNSRHVERGKSLEELVL